MTIRHVSNLLNTIFMCVLMVAVLLTWNVYQSYRNLLRIDGERVALYTLGEELLKSSMRLTRLVREAVITGDPSYVKSYFATLAERNGDIPRLDTRPIAPGERVPLRELFARYGATNGEMRRLALAEQHSNDLSVLEKEALRRAQNGTAPDLPGDAIPSRSAVRMVFDSDYQARAIRIMDELEKFFTELDDRVGQTLTRQQQRLSLQMNVLVGIGALLMVIGLAWCWYAHRRICQPLEETRRFAETVAKGDLAATIREGHDDEIGELRHMLNTMVANLRTYTETLRNLSYLDSLTGLWNRRYVIETGRRELLRSQRYGHSLAFVMIDIDEFKAINDTYGHEAGDRVLRTFSQLLRSTLRRTDIAARFGGDEFLLLLPEIDETDLRQKLETLRCHCEHSQSPSDPALHFTLSIGFSVYNGRDPLPSGDHADAFSFFVNRADSGLYASKSHGRNKLTGWTGDLRTD